MRSLQDQLYGQKLYKPLGSTDLISQGTYYLDRIDEMYRRTYNIKQ